MKLKTNPRVFFQVKSKETGWIDVAYRRTQNLTKRQIEIVTDKMKKGFPYYVNNWEYRFIIVLEEEK